MNHMGVEHIIVVLLVILERSQLSVLPVKLYKIALLIFHPPLHLGWDTKKSQFRTCQGAYFTDIPCMLSPCSPQNELSDPSHAVNTSNSPTAKRVYPSGILSKQSPHKRGTRKINTSKAVGKKRGAKGNTSGKLSSKSPHEVAPQTLLSKKYNNERAARKRLSKKSLLMEVSYPSDDGEDSQAGEDTIPRNVGEELEVGDDTIPRNVGEESEAGEDAIPKNVGEDSEAGEVAIPRNVGEDSEAGEDAIPRNVGEESEACQDEIIHEASEAGGTHVPVEDHGMLNSLLLMVYPRIVNLWMNT
jgi:hypothetical protein